MPNERAQTPADNSTEALHDGAGDAAAANAPENLQSPLEAGTDPAANSANNSAGVVVTSTTASVVKSSESWGALHDFRAGLFDLIDLPKPDNTEGPEGANSRLLALFIPGYSRRLGYNELVAKYIGLWSILEKPDAQYYSMQAFLGLKSLMSGRFTTATTIFYEIEFQTSTPAALTYVMRGVGYFIRYMLVLAFAMIYTINFVFFIDKSSNSLLSLGAFLNSTAGEVTIAAISGMLGSVVSILLRLGEFETTKGRSQMFLTLTGATLPVVGGIFGAFIAALLSSKVVNISVGGSEGLNVWLYVVIGFLSGFSERFSRGFIRIAEDRLGGGGGGDRLSMSTATIVAGTRPDTSASGASRMPNSPTAPVSAP